MHYIEMKKSKIFSPMGRGPPTAFLTKRTLLWRRVQELVRHFWHSWLSEWIPGLRSRKKWRSSSRDFAVVDIVLVIQPDTIRGNWPLGKIVAVHSGTDGHVRVVDVQIGKTVFRRPITALCPLEFRNN